MSAFRGLEARNLEEGKATININKAMQAFNDLTNPIWRLTSGEIYQIRDRSGYSVPFHPTELQSEIITSIYGDSQKVVATDNCERQRGISTLATIMMLDAMLFRPGCIVSRVSIKGEHPNYWKKKAEVLLHAMDRLPTCITAVLVTRNPAIGEYSIGVDGGVSTAYFGHAPTGSTLAMLWVDQWSEMQKRNLARAEAIRRAFFPLALRGVLFVEAANIGKPFQNFL